MTKAKWSRFGVLAAAMGMLGGCAAPTRLTVTNQTDGPIVVQVPPAVDRRTPEGRGVTHESLAPGDTLSVRVRADRTLPGSSYRVSVWSERQWRAGVLVRGEADRVLVVAGRGEEIAIRTVDAAGREGDDPDVLWRVWTGPARAK